MARLRSSTILSLASIVIISRAAAHDRTAVHAVESDRPRITAVRHWTLQNVTRIVIESSGEFRFRSEHLHDPDRLLFELLDVRPALRLSDRNAVATIDVRDAFVRQIRLAATQKGVTRLVCDLSSPVDFTTSQLTNPDRLIIELRSPLVTRRRETRTSSPLRAMLVFPSSLTRSPRIVIPDPPSPLDANARFGVNVTLRSDPLMNMSWAPRVSALPRPRRFQQTARSITPARSPLPRQSPQEISLPAKHTSSEDTMIRVLGLKLARVVIDPGHGGNDYGTSSIDGLHEKDIALDVAKRVGALIDARLGSEIVYTRTDDRFIPLTRRTGIANENKADLFLSIHVNSSPVRSVRGVETFYLNFTTSPAALETATRENAGADRNIADLQDLLKKIALKDKVDESRQFASCIQDSLLTLSPKNARSANDRGVKRAPFVVLIGASMPSVLAEIGFISNPQDENQMRRPEYRQSIAEALYEGVAAYANSLSHFQLARQSKTSASK